MIRVTYLSEEIAPWSASMLLSLLKQCHVNNPALGLTGLLIYGKGSFLQIVEGEEAVVDALLSKIMVDPRHKNFRVLGRVASDQRAYGSWSMGFRRLSEKMIEDAPELEGFALEDFNPEYLSTHPVAVENLLQVHRSQHVDPLLRELNARESFINDLRGALATERQRNEMASLLIESIIESAQDRLDPSHLNLCRAVLESLQSMRVPSLVAPGNVVEP